MKEHEHIRANVVLAASGALSQPETIEVQRHIHECDACRQEYERWAAYARSLRQLPQPTVPGDLLTRTQSRIRHQHDAASNQRWNAALLAGLTVFSWTITFSIWSIARALSGGTVVLFGVNMVDAVPWFLTSFVLTGFTGGVAALMLGSRREMRRVL